MTNAESQSFDSLLPPAMAEKAIQIGIKKSKTDFLTLFVLSILAGAFIAFGALFSTVVTTGSTPTIPYGIQRLLAGIAFSLGLILVIVGGAELFTGNMLIIMAFMKKQIPFAAVIRNWIIVYFGNFVGSLITVAIVFWGKHYLAGHGAVGLNILNIGEAKTNLGFLQAIMLGLMCNAAVCMAVWLTYSARSTTDKIMAIIPPITAFVAAGFEHSVANMYFLPVALWVKYGTGTGFFDLIQKTPADFPHLTIYNSLFGNLLPVTIGNIIGGAVMVGVVYYFVYLREK